MAELALTISARNQAQAALRQLRGDIDGVAKQVQSVSDRMRKMGDGLKNVGGKLTAGITLPVLGIGGAALKAAADYEQLQVALKVMLGDADKANTLLKEMEQFSSSTPFEFPQIAEAGKMLLAFGISSEKVIPKLRSLGDIASGVGIPIADLTLIYGQASVAGRVMTGDLNQLVGRGVPILTALAKVMGVTEAQVRKMAEEGKVSFEVFDKAIQSLTTNGGQFEGMMDEQSRTMLGLASTIKDNLTTSLRTLGTVIDETFGLSGEGGKLSQLAGSTGKLSQGIKDFAANHPELFKIGLAIAVVAAAAGPLAIGLGAVMTALAGLTPVFAPLAAAILPVVGPLALLALGIGAMYLLNIGGIRDEINNFASTLSTNVKVALDSVNQAIATFNTSFAATGDAVGAAAEAIGKLTGGKVEVKSTLPVVDVDNNIIIPATAQIISIDWTTGLSPEGLKFTYDALAGVTTIDWTGVAANLGFVYNSETGIEKVYWHEEIFNFEQDYKANAGIVDVLWGVFYYNYNSTSTIVDVAWGAYFHYYDSYAKISETSVLWGLWTNVYDAGTKISETDVLWGLWTNVYDAGAHVGEKSVLWGLWTNTYDAKGNLTSLTIAGKSPSEWLSGLSTGWTWPVLPAFAWPVYAIFAWPAYVTWAWPDYTTWTWPAYLKWTWPTFPSWDWPDIPTPPWLDAFLTALASLNPLNYLPGNAIGTSNWRGGLTRVGETRPETVLLPRGSQILSNRESMEFAGAGGVNITFAPVVSEKIDMQEALYQLVDMLSARRR